MKALIVSDTHGYHDTFEETLKEAGDFDVFIHLGDIEGEEEYFDQKISCEKHMVNGNNDYFSELPKEEEFYLGQRKVFITHGQAYQVRSGLEKLIKEGKKRQADIIMYGHTHLPYFYQDEEIMVLNPGSLTFPRQEGRKASYAILEIDEGGRLNFQQCYL